MPPSIPWLHSYHRTLAVPEVTHRGNRVKGVWGLSVLCLHHYVWSHGVRMFSVKVPKPRRTSVQAASGRRRYWLFLCHSEGKGGVTPMKAALGDRAL